MAHKLVSAKNWLKFSLPKVLICDLDLRLVGKEKKSKEKKMVMFCSNFKCKWW